MKHSLASPDFFTPSFLFFFEQLNSSITLPGSGTAKDRLMNLRSCVVL